MSSFFEKLFSSSKKVSGDKALPPEETVKIAEQRLLSSGFKICKGLKRVDKGRLGIPVFLSIYDIDGQRITGKYKQMGKGTTEAFARASALMEMVERFSLFSFFLEVPEKGIFSTFEKLQDKAMNFETFLHSVESSDGKEKKYAEKFLKKIKFYFVPGINLFEKKEKFLPFHWFWHLYEYNGSSAGNTYPEAGVQGLCEVIERHVSALSVIHPEGLSTIKRDSIKGEPEELLKKFENLNISVWIRDMTFDMPVPTIGVMAMDPSTYPERSEIVYTAGTATSPQRALIRALTEVAQLAGDFDTEGKYQESGLPKFETLKDAEHIINTKKEVSLEDLPDISNEDHVVELSSIAEKLKTKGMEVFIIDITHPLLQIPAVYVIIPGALFRERTFIPLFYQTVRTIFPYYSRDELEELIKEISESIGERYYLWAYLGNAYKREEKYEEAERCYKKALEFEIPSADRVAICSQLGDVYLKKEEPEKAMEVVEEALALEENPELYNILGRAYYKMKDYPRAMEAFLKATELNPASAIDYANVGYCLKAMNMIPAAEIFFRKALVLDPELTSARKGLEYCQSILNTRN